MALGFGGIPEGWSKDVDSVVSIISFLWNLFSAEGSFYSFSKVPPRGCFNHNITMFLKESEPGDWSKMNSLCAHQ